MDPGLVNPLDVTGFEIQEEAKSYFAMDPRDLLVQCLSSMYLLLRHYNVQLHSRQSSISGEFGLSGKFKSGGMSWSFNFEHISPSSALELKVVKDTDASHIHSSPLISSVPSSRPGTPTRNNLLIKAEETPECIVISSDDEMVRTEPRKELNISRIAPSTTALPAVLCSPLRNGTLINASNPTQTDNKVIQRLKQKLNDLDRARPLFIIKRPRLDQWLVYKNSLESLPSEYRELFIAYLNYVGNLREKVGIKFSHACFYIHLGYIYCNQAQASCPTIEELREVSERILLQWRALNRLAGPILRPFPNMHKLPKNIEMGWLLYRIYLVVGRNILRVFRDINCSFDTMEQHLQLADKIDLVVWVEAQNLQETRNKAGPFAYSYRLPPCNSSSHNNTNHRPRHGLY